MVNGGNFNFTRIDNLCKWFYRQDYRKFLNSCLD